LKNFWNETHPLRIPSTASIPPPGCSRHTFQLAFSGKSEVAICRNVVVSQQGRKTAMVAKMRCNDTVVLARSRLRTLRGHVHCAGKTGMTLINNISVPTTRFTGTLTFTFLDAVLFVNDRLFCFAVQSSPPFDRPDKISLLQKSLLEPTCGTSEHIGVYPPCINTNHLF